MQILNRISFEIPPVNEKTREASFDACVAEVLKWAQTRPGFSHPSRMPKEAVSEPRFELGPGSTGETIHISASQKQAWGIKLRSIDDSNRHLVWSSEVTLLRSEEGKIFFNCSLLIHRDGRHIAPVRRRANTPVIVKTVLEKFGGRATFPLLLTPIPLRNSGKEITVFLKALESPLRTHPIIMIAPLASENRYTTDPHLLAKHLGGMAHVVMAEDSETTRHLDHVLPRHLNCFDGAIRIYWPGFRRSSQPEYHPLYLGYQIEQWNRESPRLIGSHLHSTLAETAAYSVHEQFLTWPALERLARQEAIAQAKASGGADELLELFEIENRELEALNNELNHSLEEAQTEAARQRHLVSQLQQALSDRKTGQASGLEAALPVESVEDAIKRATSEFPGELAFAFNSVSTNQNCPFAHPDELLQAFRWLATTYFHAKSGSKPNSDLEADFSNHLPGWSYRPHQNKNTMSNPKWRSFYICFHDGRELEIPAHFKCGTSSDPRDTIRIAFAWDKQTAKVVIGFIGQHQPNTKSA